MRGIRIVQTALLAAALLLPTPAGQAETKLRVAHTSGDPDIDQVFIDERPHLFRALGVNPYVYFVDDVEGPNAFASPKETRKGFTGTVYFGIRLIRDELWSRERGRAALIGIMAHEFVHILQIRRGMSDRFPSKFRELHADLLAGWYLGRRGTIAPSDATGFVNSLFQKGDYAYWSRDHHGTPRQRMAAMMTGYRNADRELNWIYNFGLDFVRKKL